MIQLSFESHEAEVQSLKGYTKFLIILKPEITNDWFDIIINSPYALRFVEGERLLFSNFCKSLVAFQKVGTNIIKPIYSFASEGEYYIFCVKNDLVFMENEWFKVIYIKAELLISCAIFHNLSVALESYLHPDRICYPSNHPDLVIEEDCNNKVFRDDYFYIQKIFSENNIKQLYHTTSSKNVQSIKKMNGICSLQYLEENNILPTFASSHTSRHIDSQKGLANYVHLSYEPDYPMIKRALNDGQLTSCTTFVVNILIAMIRGSLFSEQNIATTKVFPTQNSSILEKIPFKRFHGKAYWNLNSEDRKYFMAEVLFPKIITSNLILNWNSI